MTTVRQLIAKLEKIPGDLEVWVQGDGCPFRKLDIIEEEEEGKSYLFISGEHP